MFFFFKQKTAYEMRISDWSSDVCSSDLVRVRQAVMYAIDRNAIIESLYGGAAEAASCGYVADQLVPSDMEPYAYDPDKARQLLDEAGWDEINGDKPITLLTYYKNPLAPKDRKSDV